MSALLDIVREARELRDSAQSEYVRAIMRAKTQHTLEEIGRAAGLTKQGVAFILKREERTK